MADRPPAFQRALNYSSIVSYRIVSQKSATKDNINYLAGTAPNRLRVDGVSQ